MNCIGRRTITSLKEIFASINIIYKPTHNMYKEKQS